VRDEISLEEHELLARIARRSYIDGRTQESIAREFGLSRQKIQRLLDRARAAGVVEIHIEAPPEVNLELEGELVRRFGLVDARVSPDRPDPESQRAAVARAAAVDLDHRLRDGMIVAVGHGRDAGDVPRYFRPARQLDCAFASAMGGSPRVDNPTNPNEICRALAAKCGGRAEPLYAPAYVESVEVRDRLLQQEAVAHTLELAARASIALVGIGGTDDDCTMVRSGCLSLAEIARLRTQGAVGDVLGNYVDAMGAPIHSPHGGRLIGLSLPALRSIETVVAVASEPEKPHAILGVLRAGVVNVLIVDETNAREVLRLVGEAATAVPTRRARSRPNVPPALTVNEARPSGQRSRSSAGGGGHASRFYP
jgi:DNA-binding transcriptional regulator LsrR (DeoR family)